MNKLLKPVDILLIAILFIGFAGFWLYSQTTSKSEIATVYIDGEIYKKIELETVSEPYVVDLPCSPAATLLVENGRICFDKAECADKVCVNTGWLYSMGDTAACLPARVVVVIENGPESEIDALVY